MADARIIIDTTVGLESVHYRVRYRKYIHLCVASKKVNCDCVVEFTHISIAVFNFPRLIDELGLSCLFVYYVFLICVLTMIHVYLLFASAAKKATETSVIRARGRMR